MGNNMQQINTSELLCNNMSNIDLSVNKILAVEPELVSFLASRFVFPKNEDNVIQYKHPFTGSKICRHNSIN